MFNLPGHRFDLGKFTVCNERHYFAMKSDKNGTVHKFARALLDSGLPLQNLTPRVCVIVSFLLVLSACQRNAFTPDYRARIGVAVQLGDRVCLAIANPKIIPGADITLVKPPGLIDGGARTARAFIVTKQNAGCPGSGSDPQVSSYEVAITVGRSETNVPVIALDSRLPSVYAAHSFHSCRSADGIHLTAWDGAKPLEGHRLWKQYYYSARSSEVRCTAAEIAP